MDISNGEGIGVSIFTQGCNRHCRNCFNPETWDFNGGQEWNEYIEKQFIKLCKKDYVTHISILGGEPLQQESDLMNLLIKIREDVKKPIWLWTGYSYEELQNNYPEKLAIVILCDVLIDGEFIQELADPTLLFRGSSNQRVINVQESLKTQDIVLYK